MVEFDGSVNSLELGAFIFDENSSIKHLILNQKKEAFLESLDGRNKGVNVFTADFNSTASVSSFSTLDLSLTSTFNYSQSAFAYMLQSWLFPNDVSKSSTANNWFTNPFNGMTADKLHCISFSNYLYKDKLIGFNSDLIFSLTGDLNGGNYFGYAQNGDSEFKYTDSTYSLINAASFPPFTDSSLIIPHLDELEINYSIIKAQFFIDKNPPFETYAAKGILLNDYGIVLLFENLDKESWTAWDQINNIYQYKQDEFTGSLTAPALYFEINNEKIGYKYEEQKSQKIINIILPWDKANYTSNLTARDKNSEEYRFIEIDHLNDLVSLSDHKKPRTYITKILLFDDELDLVAIANMNKPLKKDFLTNYSFNIKVQV